MKSAFSMLELIFVVVIIGVLASVAIPKFSLLHKNASIVKLKSDVASIRISVAAHYQKNILEGNMSCPSLENFTSDNQLFEAILDYPILKGKAPTKWDGNGNEYNVTFYDNGNKVVKFIYDDVEHNCKFRCISNCEYLQ